MFDKITSCVRGRRGAAAGARRAVSRGGPWGRRRSSPAQALGPAAVPAAPSRGRPPAPPPRPPAAPSRVRCRPRCLHL